MNCHGCAFINYYADSPWASCELDNKIRFNREKGWQCNGCEDRTDSELDMAKQDFYLGFAMKGKIEELDAPPDLSRQVCVKVEGVEYLSEENRRRIEELSAKSSGSSLGG